GKTETAWDIKAKLATIFASQGPMVTPPGGRHYSEFYWIAINLAPFSEIFAARTNLQHIEDAASPKYYVVETDPDPKPKTFEARFGWKLWLDPANGFLPVRIERYWGKDRLYTRYQLQDFQPIPGGIRMPAKATIENFDFSPTSKTFG